MVITLEELKAVLPPATWREVERQVLPVDGRGRRAAVIGEGPGRRSKYGARPTVVDGVRFDSRREARRYEDLTSFRAAGTVRWFAWQPAFILPAGVLYKADFVVAWADGRISVEDVKSPATRTKVWRLKRRQVEALYGVEVEEI
ncbi:MAG: DUF1064 domain-containing protein [Gemmatimonadetes bacterium]|nr:DUF1064 domain-containing protein [Gemmatimonadota bacterium]